MPLYADIFAPISTSAESGLDARTGCGRRCSGGYSCDTTGASTASGMQDELAGTARLELTDVRGTPAVHWAQIQPLRESVLKVECALLPKGAATSWQRPLASES